jgi:hypothetical protein
VDEKTGAEPRPVYDFAVEGPVQAEVFVLWLDVRSIMLTGPCGPEAWYIELQPDDDPLDVVVRMVRDNVGEPIVAHSTSWRRARDAVILSFVVVIDAALVGDLDSRPVMRAELARGEATSPPDSIASSHVVEHGLRHLAWLVRDDAAVRAELADAWASVLAPYVPEPFRQIRSETET